MGKIREISVSITICGVGVYAGRGRIVADGLGEAKAA
jgi:hypothetical protein